MFTAYSTDESVQKIKVQVTITQPGETQYILYVLKSNHFACDVMITDNDRMVESITFSFSKLKQ